MKKENQINSKNGLRENQITDSGLLWALFSSYMIVTLFSATKITGYLETLFATSK